MRNTTNTTLPLLLLLLATTILLLAPNAAAVRTFTDAKGETFTLPDDKKGRIVSNVIGALSLFHLGLEQEQLAAIYDHWAVRGSTIDFDDPTKEFESEFAIDPNKEEVEFLESAVNLSRPDCRETSDGCWNSIGEEELASLNGDYDFIVLFRTGNGSTPKIEEETGQKIVFIDYKWEHNTGCYGTGDERDTITNEENCWSMSLIDAVAELEKFAAFLGVEPTPKVLEEKRAMCRAASDFVEHSRTLHEKGIYAHAISFRPFNGLTMTWFSPISFPWLRTLEELGFPIVHPPEDRTSDINSRAWQIAAKDWFVNCETYPDCPDNTGQRPVDLWLLDSRTYSQVHSFLEDSIGQFPDPALTKEQYTYWQFNDGAISYTNIARYLDDVRSQTSGLVRVHDTTLECLDVDVTSRGFSNKATGGIAGVDPLAGTFACQGDPQALYLECPPAGDVPALSPAAAPEEPIPVPQEVSAAGRRAVATTALLVLLPPLLAAWMHTK